MKAFYDAHAKDLMTPEYRTVSYVVLPIAELQAKITVPEDEIKRTYEERKDEFHKPERREVDDLAFDNEQDAKSAASKLTGGASVSSVVASAPVTNKGKTSLGLVSQQDMQKAGTAPAVFALKSGETSKPVLADFVWHVYHIGKIEKPAAGEL